MLADMDDRDEWVARFWCAKEAVGKGLGRGLPSGPRSVSIGQADPRSGTIGVTLGPALAELFPDYAGGRLEVHTIRDGDLVAGSTLCQPVAQETLKN